MTPLWQKIKAKRRAKTLKLIKELKSIWNLQYAEDIHRKLRKLYLIRELKQYWETPEETEKQICTLCCASFWNEYDFERFQMCSRVFAKCCTRLFTRKVDIFELCTKKVHTVHKGCSRKQQFTCRLCSPPTFKELYGYLHVRYPREYTF